jgi:beta-galactosidase
VRMVSQTLSHKRPAALNSFYYGATYYPEHWNPDDREQDPARMAAAGFNCVRMAEFAWDYLEPEEGVHQFDIFDEAIARLGEEGIRTILGTPTATPPRWLTMAHPDVLRVNADGVRMQHGSRQHVCPSSDTFRTYSRRITRAMAEHFADQEDVVGWQTDNELNCHFSECHCPHCQVEFQAYLRHVYGDGIEALNAAWGNAFWSLTYGDFSEIPTPKNLFPAYANPAHLLDYYRFISWNMTRFQHEQVAILREVQPRWFVMHNGTFAHIDYRGEFGRDLDFLGFDVYPFFDYDPETRPYSQAFNLDHARAWTGNFMIPEQQSGPGGQAPYFHDTPEPGEVRRMAYTSIAHGADSLLFFRWRTARFGAEEYWCGVIDHDNVPRRRYEEVKQLGRELQVVGPEILGTTVRVDVGIAAADVDVYDAHSTMSFGLPSPRQVAETVHTFFTRKGYAVGCVHPSDDLSNLKLYVIPHWALFNPAWLPNLQAFVEGGGVLVLGARTATKDWHNNVVAETPPGVLARLAGVQIIEYGRQNAPEKRPLTVRFYPGNSVAHSLHWYEHVDTLPGTTTIARWVERHLKLKTAVTARAVGAGSVIYVGTYFTGALLEGLLPALTERYTDVAPLLPQAPEGVHVVVRENAEKRLWFVINASGGILNAQELPEGVDLLRSVGPGAARPATYAYMTANEVRVIKETL